jgi:uncharacterized protein YdeI (YjbR/CyaY-like superfamily)
MVLPFCCGWEWSRSISGSCTARTAVGFEVQREALRCSVLVLRRRARHAADVGIADGERLHVEDVQQWRSWLLEHADRGVGVWLVSWKRATGRPAITYEQAIEEALTVGWVDSTAGTIDGERSMLWFAPRKPGSGWSRPNKQRLERLERDGRMQERGRSVVARAQRDGSWTLLDDVEDLVVPPDLAAAFAERAGSGEQWEAFPRSVKRAQLEQVVLAKRPETRARRIAAIADGAARGERALVRDR